MGTERNGLYLVEPKKVRTLTTEQGLITDDVWSIAEARDRSVWIAGSGGVTHLNAGRLDNYIITDGLKTRQARCVAEDSA